MAKLKLWECLKNQIVKKIYIFFTKHKTQIVTKRKKLNLLQNYKNQIVKVSNRGGGNQNTQILTKLNSNCDKIQ